MAVFKVGQRVRIVKTTKAHWALGLGATVVGYAEEISGEYRISIDGHGELWPNGKRYTAPPEALEPLQPDRNQAVAWTECAWRPEHLREVA